MRISSGQSSFAKYIYLAEVGKHLTGKGRKSGQFPYDCFCIRTFATETKPRKGKLRKRGGISQVRNAPIAPEPYISGIICYVKSSELDITDSSACIQIHIQPCVKIAQQRHECFQIGKGDKRFRLDSESNRSGSDIFLYAVKRRISETDIVKCKMRVRQFYVKVYN